METQLLKLAGTYVIGYFSTRTYAGILFGTLSYRPELNCFRIASNDGVSAISFMISNVVEIDTQGRVTGITIQAN